MKSKIADFAELPKKGGVAKFAELHEQGLRSSENFPFSLRGRLLGKCPYTLHSPGAPMPHPDPSPPRLLQREKGMQRGGGHGGRRRVTPLLYATHPLRLLCCCCSPHGPCRWILFPRQGSAQGAGLLFPRGWLARSRRWPAVLHTPGDRVLQVNYVGHQAPHGSPPLGLPPSLGCVRAG